MVSSQMLTALMILFLSSNVDYLLLHSSKDKIRKSEDSCGVCELATVLIKKQTIKIKALVFILLNLLKGYCFFTIKIIINLISFFWEIHF